MQFKPTYESLKAHKIPNWYDDAKLGIFIHWGLYSVPGYAEPGEEEISLTNIDFAEMPYSEWYYNKLRIPNSSTEKYHSERYGKDFSYFEFAIEFEEKTENFDAIEWAKLFKKAGAKYAILTTKHHDGYLLWPSRHENATKKGYYSKKDLVGEITEKVRAEGLKMGLYYSGVFDWTYITQPIDDYVAMFENQRQSTEYIEYATNHFYELIEKYRPSVLWNDIGYPYGYDLNELFAHYYNEVPEGVINNRWSQIKVSKLVTNKVTKKLINSLILAVLKRADVGAMFDEKKTTVHTDFKTPEYETFDHISEKKFESTRGIGHSFAYNHLEDESHMLTGKELVYMLCDIVSKNGNLLINVGPMADGTIPEMQQKPLLEMGAWLDTNGEAIYSTRPWTVAEGVTQDGINIRFTKKGYTLYAIILSESLNDSITIKDLYLPENAKISLVGNRGTLQWSRKAGDVKVSLPSNIDKSIAYVLKIENGVL